MQKVVTERLTDRVVDNMDIEAVTALLSKSPADAGARPAVVDRIVGRVVTGDAFQQATPSRRTWAR